MTLLAIAPVLLLLPLGAVVAVTALLKLRPKKSEPSSAPPVPTPDPGSTGTVPKPFLNLRVGAVRGSLTRDGVAWRWTVARADDVKVIGAASGSEDNPTDGVVSMMEAVRREIGDALGESSTVGSAGGGGNETLAFGIEPHTAWDWTVTTTGQVAGNAMPTPPKLLANGSFPLGNTGYVQAFAAIMDELDKYIDWTSLARQPAPSPEGAAPTPPAGEEGDGFSPKLPFVRQFHGLVISGSSVGVADMPQWLAYAAPLIVEDLDKQPLITADALMDQVLGSDYPDGVKLSGKPIADVRRAVERTLDAIRSSRYTNAMSPDRKLAAEMVGSAFADSGSAFQYHGRTFVVRPGASANRWEFLIFEGNARGLDADAIKVGGVVGNRNNAIRRARSEIDNIGGV